ncbi:MAG TPA: ABC transporter substrate-binding protein [Mycobacteriales bacterium]|jgi:ABC-type branched-subunit amino acid transport system substrate-binding protein|nr:ABC transporter substrate-binding protein [Mycobacteriales bacterium]
MRTTRAIAILMLAGLIGTACGARLPAPERQQAANAILSQGGGTGSGTGAGTSGAPNPGSSTKIVGGSKATKGTKGSSATQGSSGSKSINTKGGGTNPGAPKGSKAAACPTGGTDVGETSNSIALGDVADVTGPVNGLFAGAKEGAVAFSSFINQSGGLCGHSVNVDFADSGTNCSQNQNDTSSLISKVFAFVGSFSLYDGIGCGATVLKAHPTVPDVHVALDPTAETLSNHFDLEPGELGYATGMWKYFAQKYGSKVKSVGTISEDIPSAAQKQAAEVHAAESQGWKFTYQNAAAPTASNFTSNFQTMCGSDHIKIFFTVTEDAQNAATMIQNEHSISACKGVINIIPIAYDPSFIPDFQGNASELNGLQGWNEYSLFFNKNEAADIPEVKLLQTWFARTNPGQPLNLYAMFAWADGRMFQQAYANSGKTANRASVLAALRKIKNFSDNGLIAPTNPGSKTTGNHCYILWQLENGQFSRMSDPKSGYRCDGTFLPAK